MTKWFDTNYHYLVPEIGPATTFALNPPRCSRARRGREQGIPARPVIIGPVTFLLLSKAVDGAGAPIERLDDWSRCTPSCSACWPTRAPDWVQIDEPALVTDSSPTRRDWPAVYTAWRDGPPARDPRRHLLRHPGAALPALARTPVEAIGIDLVAGADTPSPRFPSWPARTGGRCRRRSQHLAHRPGSGAEHPGDAAGHRGRVAVSTSCSTLHVPYSLEPETELDDALRSWLAFGTEKVAEVVTLATRPADGAKPSPPRSALNARGRVREDDPRLHNGTVRARSTRHRPTGAQSRRPERRDSQQARLHLPPLPTTTIGSYPQTPAIRKARAALSAGRDRRSRVQAPDEGEIADVIKLQEELGLDVLVHGEPERNDMVQYFAEQLDGFFATTTAGCSPTAPAACARRSSSATSRARTR